MVKIQGGYILLAKQIFGSEIWDKPAWWLKVWVYLIIRVNYENDKPYRNYKKGQGFFTLESIKKECRLHGITVKSVQHPIRWLKAEGQIETTKVTHGMDITICNYNTYQDLANYKSDNESDGKWDRRGIDAGQARDRTIGNSLKNKNKNLPKINKRNKRIKKDIYSLKNDEDKKYLFDKWNSLGIIRHREFSKYKPSLAEKLKHYTRGEIEEAFCNLKAILDSDDHYYSHKWDLYKFLTQKNAFDKFLTVNNPFKNFKTKNFSDISKENPEQPNYKDMV